MNIATVYPVAVRGELQPELSRWLWLVKWLLAIPHLVLVGVFVGWGWTPAGLVGILAVIAGFVLLFTRRYPFPLFDFVLGLDRWALRVAAYVGLMRDEYPPFRFDAGADEPERGEAALDERAHAPA